MDTWNSTKNNNYKWILIISDDGSDDGTIEYIQSLRFDGVDIYPIFNNRCGIHHQTNTIFDICNKLDFDFAFKSDDDIIFKKSGWDDNYFNTAMTTKMYHLCFNDINRIKRKGLYREPLSFRNSS